MNEIHERIALKENNMTNYGIVGVVVAPRRDVGRVCR
jgi:hypothetical protein